MSLFKGKTAVFSPLNLGILLVVILLAWSVFVAFERVSLVGGSYDSYSPPLFNTLIADAATGVKVASVGACDSALFSNDGPITIQRGTTGEATLIQATGFGDVISAYYPQIESSGIEEGETFASAGLSFGQFLSTSVFYYTPDGTQPPNGTNNPATETTSQPPWLPNGVTTNVLYCPEADVVYQGTTTVTSPEFGGGLLPITTILYSCDKARLSATTQSSTPLGSFSVGLHWPDIPTAPGGNTDVEFIVVDGDPPEISVEADPNVVFPISTDPAAPKNSTLTYKIFGEYDPSTCVATSTYTIDNLPWPDTGWANNDFSSDEGTVDTEDIIDLSLYELRCADFDGNIGVGRAIIGVNESVTYDPAPIISLTAQAPGVAPATEITVPDGETVTLDWTFSGGPVYGCEFTDSFTNPESIDYLALTKNEGPLNTSGSYVYSMICTGPGGFSNYAGALVHVGSQPPSCGDSIPNGSEECDGGASCYPPGHPQECTFRPPTATLVTSETAVDPFGNVDLTWTAQHASMCTGSMGSGSDTPLDPSGGAWSGPLGDTGSTVNVGPLEEIIPDPTPGTPSTYQFEITCNPLGASAHPPAVQTVDVTVNPAPTCGDGNIDTGIGEECDGGNLGGTQCTDLGFSAGTLGCYPPGHPQECQFDTVACTGGGPGGPVCGNGVTEPPEDCDDGSVLNGTPGNCNATCTGPFTYPPIVGTCTAAPTTVNPGETVRWEAINVSGGNGNYTYGWLGSQGLFDWGAGVTFVDYTYTNTGTDPITVNTQLSITDSAFTPVAVISCPIVTVNGSGGPGVTECSDGIDNDGDGLSDANDPGCPNPTDDLEENCGTETPAVCQAISGENPLTCPADCSSEGIEEF